MLARHRLLAARGWAVISVPLYVWNELNDAARGAWLMQACLLRKLLLPASLPLLWGRPAQGTRSVSTRYHTAWWEAHFAVLCGLDERWAHAVRSAGDSSRARGTGGRCSTAARCPAACAQVCGVGCHARAAAHV